MQTTTAEDLRAELARRQIRLYLLAAQIGVHPGRLGMMLSGSLELQPEIAERVLDALSDDRMIRIS